MRDRRLYQLKRYRLRREQAITTLGGMCVICGRTDNLEIDHVDPSQKSFSLSQAWGTSEQLWFNELSKCQLLCYDHHKEKTRHELTVTDHGTRAVYDRGCRCEECRKAKAKAQKEWDQKRIWCKSCKKIYYRKCPKHDDA